MNTNPVDTKSNGVSVRSYRVAGAGLFGGGVLMLIAAMAEEEPLLLCAGLLQLVGWLCFVQHANRVERQ